MVQTKQAFLKKRLSILKIKANFFQSENKNKIV